MKVRTKDIPSLVAEIVAGRRRAIARLISWVESGEPLARLALAQLYPHTGQAYVVGVTGAPGSGKSTMVGALARAFRLQGVTIGVIAVDPSSPFSGGALLGDRVRMYGLAGDPGVFVRSMASRGRSGGVAGATGDVIHVLDAAGHEIILVETVGAGQAEVDIAALAHTVVVVQTPGSGDEIQAIKAGLLEIADVFAVNKADHEGAEQTVSVLSQMLDLGRSSPLRERLLHHAPLADSMWSQETPAEAWRPPIVPLVAVRDEGVAELMAAIKAHREYLKTTGEWLRRDALRLLSELDMLLREALLRGLVARTGLERLQHLLQQMLAREIDPCSAVQQLLPSLGYESADC